MGEEIALVIYYRLLDHTRAITENLPVKKFLYYSEYVDTEDNWSNSLYQKAKQSAGHLGERMKEAFEAAFAQGCDAAVVIGTDCMELSSDIIMEAFQSLSVNDAVIGPAVDGGYYLLGLKAFYPEVFENKTWSSDTVLRDTESDLAKLNLKWCSLPLLRDVDTFDDLNDPLKTILIRNRGTSNSSQNE